jgi:hypothetical protein
MNREIRDLKNWLGRLVRDIERNKEDKILSYEFQQLLATSQKLLTQEKKSKHKIYSLHELDICCISKGNAIGSAFGFNMRKLLNLLKDRGFSRALYFYKELLVLYKDLLVLLSIDQFSTFKIQLRRLR